MKRYCQENLLEIKNLILKLSDDDFVYKSNLLSQSTIGQHVRHIIEFYRSSINKTIENVVNYDKRERNILIETDRIYAISKIEKICLALNDKNENHNLLLEGNFSFKEGVTVQIQTSFFRELAYCLEHSIHHQALIKIALKELNIEDIIPKSFGIAPATNRYREKCVQ